MAVVAQPDALYHINTAGTSSSRPREISVSSVNSQLSLASSTSDSSLHVRPKRQQDFEKHFASRIRELSPESDMEVLMTQSCDWQSNILLHGRLYLTRQFLCFRSNILGYVTEQVHPLKDVVSLERGTTAKWIQNAVYVSVKDGEDPEGTHYGYGSLKDRDAMHDAVLEAWRVEAPEAAAADKAPMDQDKTTSDSISQPQAKESQGTGEHYSELAIDICFPIPLKELFDLLYHNDEFMMDFLKNDKKLTDIKISQWDSQPQTRTLTYVMHMTGMGPSESDCYGSETLAVADEATSYEIASETRTPGVPSGRKFVIRTRTVLTHTDMNGKDASRMHCTTECDWESSSWLKSTITPAVIKGQREHHKQLAKKISGWIQAHGGDQSVAVEAVPVSEGFGKGSAPLQPESATVQESNPLSHLEDLWSHASQITGNPVMIGIIAVLLAIILLK